MISAGPQQCFAVLDGPRGVAPFVVVFCHFSMGTMRYRFSLSFWGGALAGRLTSRRQLSDSPASQKLAATATGTAP
jgi:peptidoglycan/LPS O-acetylase OafA/YrhL